MLQRLIFTLLTLLLLSLNAAQAEEASPSPAPAKKTVYVLPVKGQISKAQLYIVRRGLKQALSENIDSVLIDMDTPGGAVDITLQIMEALGNYTGDTLTFVNTEAISAGAYISASTQHIYFHPNGLLGAAAVIQGTGQEVGESLKQKIDSYLFAKVRSVSEDYRYRAQVIRAMMDDDYVLEIDGTTIKNKGELLTLTAKEALQTFGSPPEALLASGIADSVEGVLDAHYGKGTYTLKTFNISWSEELAKWLNKITPVLLGLGMLCLFIEFKTPGFGVFGITGITLLLIVFGSSYVAGLAGYEEILVFIVGILLIAVEVLILPGTVFFGLIGLFMVLGSLIWALADIWPTEDFEFTSSTFTGPLIDVALGFLIASVGVYILARFFFKKWIWDALVLKAQVAANHKKPEEEVLEIGDQGVVVTDLHPVGQIEVRGKRYEAQAQVGEINRGSTVQVEGKTGFNYIVREI